MSEGGRKVTPLGTVAMGAAALTLGGLLGGLSHYHGTTKSLVEEGIDPRLRLRALPLAVRLGAGAAAAQVCTPRRAGLSRRAAGGQAQASVQLPSHPFKMLAVRPPCPQSKALGVSLGVSVLLGVVGVAAWSILGLESKEVAEVAGFLDAVALAKQHRVRRRSCHGMPALGWPVGARRHRCCTLNCPLMAEGPDLHA